MSKNDNNEFDFGEFDTVDSNVSSIDIQALLGKVLGHWKMILICGLVASIVGILIGLDRKSVV